tara:strand:- start:77 stop:310 length:234 start_codon:yes stop_codon:yes gene_type:complete
MIPPKQQDGKRVRDALRLVALVGLTISASILTGTWVGFNLDRVIPADGLWTVLGILAGLLAGLLIAGWLLYRETRQP